MANITIPVQSFLNSATTLSITIDDGQTVANLKTAINTAEGTPTAIMDLFFNNNKLANATVLSAVGLITGSYVKSSNNLTESGLWTKQQRQDYKLQLAQLRRQAGGDSSKPYYRSGNVYDLTSLPDTYNGNDSSPDDNPNTDGLLLGRPWVGIAAVLVPETLSEALPASVLLELESWYDGSDGEYFVPNNPADGDTFTQWTDKSSFAHNANPIGGATTRATVQINEQNTLSVVRFDGNDGLDINPYASLASAPALTIFTVMKMTTTAGNPVVFATNSGATALTYDTVSSKFLVKAADGIGTSTIANDNSAFHIHTFAFDGTQTTNAASLKYRYDKSDITLNFGATTVGDTLSASNIRLYIGNNNGANFYTGDIGELLIFTKVLTTIEIQNVENYLSNKWGL